MSDEARRIARLSDDELGVSAVMAAQNERKSMHTVLLHIKEVERRRYYLKAKCENLFEYVTTKMKYSEGSANRRIAAARLLKDLPEIAESIQSGSLNLSNLVVLQSTIRAVEKKSHEKFDLQEKRELVELIQDKTTETVIRELVEMFPQTARQEKTRKVTGHKTEVTVTFDEEQIKMFNRVKELESHKNDNFSWQELFVFLAEYHLKHKDPLLKPLCKKPAKKDRKNSKVRTAHSSKMEGTAKVPDEIEATDLTEAATRTVRSIKCAEGEIVKESEEPIPFAIEAIEMEGDGGACASTQCFFKATANADGVSSSADSPNQRPADFGDSSQKIAQPQWVPVRERHSRYVSAYNHRALHHRSGSQCEWVDPVTGERCTRRYHLQPDHIVPHSKGGSSELENLQLLCRPHNLIKGSALFR